MTSRLCEKGSALFPGFAGTSEELSIRALRSEGQVQVTFSSSRYSVFTVFTVFTVSQGSRARSKIVTLGLGVTSGSPRVRSYIACEQLGYVAATRGRPIVG